MTRYAVTWSDHRGRHISGSTTSQDAAETLRAGIDRPGRDAKVVPVESRDTFAVRVGAP